MSDKRTKLRQRRQAYRRLHGEKKAVSPVVATLILILIAVAAAAALYLWLVVWQGNLTKGIGQPTAQATLTIGGSTSVYPFSSLAVSWFEQNNSDVVISDNQGGTGAGMIAVCEGNVDLGASSTPQTVSTLESSYGCSSTYASTIQINTVAYDAVDVVIQKANTHGLLSISADTLNTVYEQASSTTPSAFIGSINGVATSALATVTNPAVTYGTITAPLDWNQIPAMTIGGSTVVSAVTYNEFEDTAAGVVAPVAGTGVLANDVICAGYAAPATCTSATPCGFSICATGAVAIQPVERSDASGTTQTFEAKVLGYGSGPSSSATSWVGATTSSAAQTGSDFANLGYAGCGSNNLLADCGLNFPTAQQGNGNPGVLAIVAANANAIGYASDGLARTTANIGIVPLLGLGQGVGGAGLPVTSGSTYAYGGVVPSTGTTGTIAAGLTNSATINQYVGGRPFELVSLQPLTGVAQEFLTFITDPAVNAALASATAEVGLYQVV